MKQKRTKPVTAFSIASDTDSRGRHQRAMRFNVRTCKLCSSTVNVSRDSQLCQRCVDESWSHISTRSEKVPEWTMLYNLLTKLSKKAWYYKHYLRSDLWATIKARVLKRDGGLCHSCQRPATTVHHKSYAARVLRGNDDAMLVTVCDSCHNDIHLRDDGSKRSLEEANALLATMAGRRQS